MEETMKVVVVIGSAVLMGLLGMAIRGLLGALMGFVITILVVGLFVIWKNMENS